MKKRLSFKCYNCNRKYSLFLEITDQQELIVPCPFCNVEAVVELAPFRQKKIPVLRKIDLTQQPEQPSGYEYDLPDVISTQPASPRP